MIETDRQKALIKTLSDMPDNVIATAYVYAKSLIEYGVDVSEKWETVTSLTASLDVAYQRGRHDERARLVNKEWRDMTNADRIRAMSDEELAAFLDSIVQDWYSGTAQIGGEIIVDNWLAWLQLSTRPQQRKRKRECEDWDGWKKLKE